MHSYFTVVLSPDLGQVWSIFHDSSGVLISLPRLWYIGVRGIVFDRFLCLYVCTFLCFFVSKITRKRLDRFAWIFKEDVEWTWDNLIKFFVNSEKPRDAAMRNTGTGFVVLSHHSLLFLWPIVKARGYAYAKIEYVSVRTYLSKNRIRVWYVSYAEFNSARFIRRPKRTFTCLLQRSSIGQWHDERNLRHNI